MFILESQNKEKDFLVKLQKEKEDEIKRMDQLNELNLKAIK